MANMDKKLAKQYQSMTALEHIAKKPDTYIGAIEIDNLDTWVLNEDNTKFEYRTVKWVPGLYKCFDEAIVNARDHAIRMALSKEKKKHLVKNINISCHDGVIEIMNDGNGIDIAKHPKDKLWIPEMIFMHLRTSTNYDDEEKKLVGGKNGFGIKLVFVFAKWGEIETVDHIRKLKYTQRVEHNLKKIHPPKIVSYTGKPYTRVRWMPDYEKFGLTSMTTDIWDLLRKRAFDIAAVTSKTLKVKIQDENVNITSFEQYVDMYIGNKSDVERANQETDRWECIVALSPLDEFTQVSFVNGIHTGKGGKHVDYIINQITKKMIEYIKRKKKVTVKAVTIKEQLMIFVNCMIENPAFDSQTKDYMNTPYNKFGSKFEITDKVIDKLAKMGVMDAAISLNEVKQNKDAKKTDGRKSRNIRGIPKLVDANKAGGPSSAQCTLILTEGDSAKAGVMSGLSKEDRNWFGVFPLKGKLLNTRDSALSKINNNAEIANIKKIMGLQTGKRFKDKEEMIKILRYGKIMILTDQDLDGHHIKGLTINLFSSQWHDLFKMNNFLGYMNTPIIKATRGSTENAFYNEKDYEDWKVLNNNGKGWKIKYYKGLGTSSGKEFKEYFAKKKFIMFNFTGDISEDAVDKAFNKSRADDRKTWLSGYDKNVRLDVNKKKCPVEHFIDRELIHFAKYDCERSICNLVDGFKTSQRKITYAAFKRNLIKEIKVAQFSGYVSEHSAYHHGEMSLNMAIVKLAQEFTGANNINVLMPNGQFGCVDPETDILLWDSTIKKAKYIKIGDTLIGDDGLPRNVTKTIKGRDTMYKIKNGRMNDYIVNSNHILTCQLSGHKSIYWKKSSRSWKMFYYDKANKKFGEKTIRTNENPGNHFNKSKLTKDDAYTKILEFSRKIQDDPIFDINLQEYLKLPKYIKQHIKGVLNKSVVKWKEKKVDIDPYILGSWLGDGHSDCHAFSSIDPEIIKSWAIWLDGIGCETVHCQNYNEHESATYYIRRRGSGKDKSSYPIGSKLNSKNNCKGCQTSKITTGACDWSFDKKEENYPYNGYNIDNNKGINLNPFKEIMKKNTLFKNKHVPIDYIVNSEENRLKLLAGMIDTDGSIKKQKNTFGYRIFQCEQRKNILESLRIVAGSLGFRAKIYNCKENMLELMITGHNLEKIPVKVERKKIQRQSVSRNDPMLHSIKVEEIEKADFCGWHIDSNERFLLGDFTITHNTRLGGGKDHASERYIFTMLNKLTRYIFPEADDKILKYLDDDGTLVEPEHYLPILPMILVNGGKGIGTGFSQDVMSYNVKSLCACVKSLLKKETKLPAIEPYYEGFEGKIIKTEFVNKNDEKIYLKYLFKGNYKIISSDTIRVTELPIGYWTDSFKEDLEDLMDDRKKKSPIIRNIQDDSTDATIDFKIKFVPGVLSELATKKIDENMNMLEKVLKLITSKKTSNMYLFDDKQQLHKYHTVEDIIKKYFPVRLIGYKDRKTYLLHILSRAIAILSNKARFIKEQCDGTIDLRRKKKDAVIQLLKSRNYNIIDDDQDYKYLRTMTIDSLEEENIAKLLKDKEIKMMEYKELNKTTIEQLWLNDLEKFEDEYDKYCIARKDRLIGTGKKKKAKKKKNN